MVVYHGNIFKYFGLQCYCYSAPYLYRGTSSLFSSKGVLKN